MTTLCAKITSHALRAEDSFIVLPELLNPLIRERMMRHLLEHLIRHGRDVRSRQRAVDHMDRMAHARRDDLRLDVVQSEDVRDAADEIDARHGNIVEPPEEGDT